MKKHLLFALSGLLLSMVAISQTPVTLVNPSFEIPDDSVKVTCENGWTYNGDTIPFNLVPGFGWRVDNCADVGREVPSVLNKNIHYIGAYDGKTAAYSHNMGQRIYQIVEPITTIGTTYTLTAQSVYSWSDGATAYTGLYFSVFSGTDTTNRTVLKGDSVMFTIADIQADTNLVQWTEGSVSYITQAADAGKHLCIEFGNWADVGSWTYFYHDGFTLTKVGGTPASIKNIAGAQFNVSPNPSNGIFNIKLNEIAGYKVIDLTGKEIASGQLKQINNTIDLTRFGSGVYMLQVNTLYKTSFSKLIVK